MGKSLSKLYVHLIFSSKDAHHRSLSFQDECRLFLKRYEIGYDERYVWD
jgi:hypothetical protein